MSHTHMPTDDIFYDLVSIQYHALKGAQVYGRYLQDAHEHTEVREFIDRVRQEDADRAVRAHQLMYDLTRETASAGRG